jgi:hypothetical protein
MRHSTRCSFSCWPQLHAINWPSPQFLVGLYTPTPTSRPICNCGLVLSSLRGLSPRPSPLFSVVGFFSPSLYYQRAHHLHFPFGDCDCQFSEVGRSTVTHTDRLTQPPILFSAAAINSFSTQLVPQPVLLSQSSILPHRLLNFVEWRLPLSSPSIHISTTYIGWDLHQLLQQLALNLLYRRLICWPTITVQLLSCCRSDPPTPTSHLHSTHKIHYKFLCWTRPNLPADFSFLQMVIRRTNRTICTMLYGNIWCPLSFFFNNDFTYTCS